jgi:hypothetical protein
MGNLLKKAKVSDPQKIIKHLTAKKRITQLVSIRFPEIILLNDDDGNLIAVAFTKKAAEIYQIAALSITLERPILYLIDGIAIKVAPNTDPREIWRDVGRYNCYACKDTLKVGSTECHRCIGQLGWRTNQ